jgi:hypothetical protein
MRMLLEHPPELLLLPPSPQARAARPPSSQPLLARFFPRAAYGAAPHKGPTCPPWGPPRRQRRAPRLSAMALPSASGARVAPANVS